MWGSTRIPYTKVKVARACILLIMNTTVQEQTDGHKETNEEQQQLINYN